MNPSINIFAIRGKKILTCRLYRKKAGNISIVVMQEKCLIPCLLYCVFHFDAETITPSEADALEYKLRSSEKAITVKRSAILSFGPSTELCLFISR